MRKSSKVFSAMMAVLFILVITSGSACAFGSGRNVFRSPRNVIVMVPDGCDQNIQTLARWYKKYGMEDDEPLNLDKMVRGNVSTYMANSLITGSAAAATAFSTGYKTSARFIGIGPRTSDLLKDLNGNRIDDFEAAVPFKPLATVLEAAKLDGKATGLISTSRITHATPAAYGAHVPDRGMDNEIMEHLVYNDIDVVFGGGGRHLIPESAGGRRSDGENLRQELLARGYAYVDTAAEMERLSSGKAWGMFATSHMSAEIDRQFFNLDQPSLSEMTAKALELLSRARGGYFLMIEGSQVDWAGHANDPAYMVTDFLEFDKAVGVALEYAEKDPFTTVLVFPDHNTGGMTIGNDNFNNYTATSIADIVEPLTKMRVTAGGLASLLPESFTIAELQEHLVEYWGLEITDEDAAILVGAGDVIENEVYDHIEGDYLTLVLQKYLPIGWTTHGHTGGDVPLWVYSGDNSRRVSGLDPALPVGLLDNTELAEITADLMHVNLERAEADLYIEAREAFDEYEMNMTDPHNPVLEVDGYRLPTNKDLLITPSGDTINLEGLVVYFSAEGHESLYVPEQAVEYIRSGR
jgi:alkaline phosphatase